MSLWVRVKAGLCRLAVATAVLCALAAGYQSETTPSVYPVMSPDPDTMWRWLIDYETAPEAASDPAVEARLQLARILGLGTSMDLRGRIIYDAGRRDQGSCGNCWVWSATTVLEVARAVQAGIPCRLSVQYFNSCWPGTACCGGTTATFASWYTGRGLAVPWDNPGAAYADVLRACSDWPKVGCRDIAGVPNYPLTSVRAEKIRTRDAGQAAAIDNIKNILNQNRAVYFWFALPNAAAWQTFFDFWNGTRGETEATLCGLFDEYRGVEWEDGQGGGHAMVILGYNDAAPDPAAHYWIALNSWGDAGGVRPNGLMRVPMRLDYNATLPDANNKRTYQSIGFETLSASFRDRDTSAEPEPRQRPERRTPSRLKPPRQSN